MKGDRDKCIAAGMDDYISKPVERRRLFETIAKWTQPGLKPAAGADRSGSPPRNSSAPVASVPPTTAAPVANSIPAAKPAAPAAAVVKPKPAEKAAATPEQSQPSTALVSTRASTMSEPPARKSKSTSVDANKPKILLVDDDDTLRLLVKSRLEKDNCFVIAAGDGEDALAKFNKQKPDIVISDVFMPKMDGFELCRQIRKIDSTIPIVMLTSMNDVKDRINGLDAGADDYIVKPFSPKELEARVRSLLRRREAAGTHNQDEGSAGTAVVSRAQSSKQLMSQPQTISVHVGSADVVAKIQALDKLLGALRAHAASQNIQVT
jgi:DNA-binding response OmpR family regulator